MDRPPQPPHLIQGSTPDKIHATAASELKRGINQPGFIMGTAVIPFGTRTENILAVKQACLEAAAV